jgi:hypothetical protein
MEGTTALIGFNLRKGVMMKRWVRNLVGVLAVLLACATARAELKLVANFDGMTGTPDGQPCNGVLGGTIDTESEGTGNVTFQTNSGSTTLSPSGHSSGTLTRAAGIAGINNPIANDESGIAFFRFSMPTGNTIRSHIGLIADTGNNPINATRAADPKTIPAGFRLVDNGAGFDLLTLDGATALKPGLARGQWYNVWIVADNATDTFDLYLSKATAPAGPPTLPTSADLIQSGIPFTVPTTGALAAMIFACPAATAGTAQGTRIYVDEIWWDGDQGLSKPVKASDAGPADRASDVPRDVVLSWMPGPSAATHDVYFGTSLDTVTNADRANPLDVLASKGQTATTFDPAGSLEFGQTYYWRVDEVNAPPDSTVFKGSVWSFTVEPVSYRIAKVTATASSATEGMGPEKSVDGSGLNNNNQHGTEPSQMWLSAADGPQPTWIQYEFDGIYKVHQLVVWNSNQMLESVLGFGAKGVTVEYSTDAAAWTKLGDFEFARAPGTATYAGNAPVDFGGAVAKYVRLTVNSNWGGVLQQYGLSEVRFFYIPVLPREPIPAVAQKNVDVDAALSWRAGREAASHQVYFSTDQQAVSAGTAPVQTVASSRFDPGGLDLGRTYFWKVAEVNEAQTPPSWESSVWSFSTREYLAIDDFESYTDQPGNEIFTLWADGMVNSNGSLVGYLTAAKGTFGETTIVHGGKQSMPFEYNNVKPPYYSEAERIFDQPQDWTVHGADTLTLYFRGNATAFAEAAGKITMSGAGTDIWNSADEFRFACKSLTGDGTIVAKVESVDNPDAWAKAGVMIRESLDPGSRFAAVYATPGNGVRYQARTLNGGAATSDTAAPPTAEQLALKTPVWIKAERKGSSFNCYYSTDGVKWTSMVWNPQTINMTAATVYLGLAVTGHDSGTAIGVFSNIATTGNVTGSWQVQAIGVAQPTNDAAPLYVVVQDSAGKSKTIVHPDPAATTLATWQEWRIPLSDLSAGGVKLAAVKKLVIGVGDRANPKPDGAGTLYFDDFGFGHPASQ